MAHVVNVPNGTEQGPLLIRVSVAIYAVAVVFVTLRFLTRGLIVRKYGLDDCLIAVAVILGVVQTATIVLQVRSGRGHRSGSLPIQRFNDMLMFKWVNMLVYYVANWAVKMSILALYHRIGSGQKGLPWVLRAKVIWTIAGCITAFTIAIFFAHLFSCRPVSRAWDMENMHHGCVDMHAFDTAQGSVNVVIDFLLLVFPLPLLWILKINTKQRSALVAIFSVGAIPLVASIMRLCEIIMASAPKGNSWLDVDMSWRWAWIPVWSQIEVDVSIVAASLPSLNPLLKRIWSGFAAQRSMTPSQILTLAGPLESRGLQPLPSRSAGSIGCVHDSKSLMFFDDGRDVEGNRGHEVLLAHFSGVEVEGAKIVEPSAAGRTLGP